MAKNNQPITQALIIASEVTKGMKSIGSKSLLRLKNSTLLIEYQIKELQKQHPGINIAISTGFESDKMVKALSNYDVENLTGKKLKENKTITIKNTISSSFTHYSASYQPQVFISQIGIYDENRNLIAIAKLANPVRKTKDLDYTFKLKIGRAHV